MAKNRDTYKYFLKRGNEIIHVGITNDLQHREKAVKDTRSASKTVKPTAGGKLSQRTRIVKSSAKTGSVTRTKARSVVRSVAKS